MSNPSPGARGRGATAGGPSPGPRALGPGPEPSARPAARARGPEPWAQRLQPKRPRHNGLRPRVSRPRGPPPCGMLRAPSPGPGGPVTMSSASGPQALVLSPTVGSPSTSLGLGPVVWARGPGMSGAGARDPTN